MNLFRPWIGSRCEGDPQVGGHGMSLALLAAKGRHHSVGFAESSTASLSPTSPLPNGSIAVMANKAHQKAMFDRNGSPSDSKSCYSYYYQYYYSQLIATHLVNLQQQQQQQSLHQQQNGTTCSKDNSNCRSPWSTPMMESTSSSHRTKSSSSNNSNKHGISRYGGNNLTKHSTGSSAEWNCRLNRTHPAHMNRSHTESKHSTLESVAPAQRNGNIGVQHPTTRNPSSVTTTTSQQACEMEDHSKAPEGKHQTTNGGHLLEAGKVRTGTEGTSHSSVQPTPTSLNARQSSTSSQTAVPVRTPSMSDIQNLLTFQNLFLDSFGSGKKRATKSSTDQRPKKFICSECKSGFSNRSQLNSHIRTHTGERPFVCDYKNCQKSFTRNEELTRHRRIHSGIRPYPCRWCDKRFGRKDHLRKHERTHERRLRSTILLNYTASLSATGQLFAHQAHSLNPSQQLSGVSSSSSNCSSSASSVSSCSAELLTKTHAASGLPSVMQHHNGVGERANRLTTAAASLVNSSCSSMSIDLSRNRQYEQQPQSSSAAKLLTAAASAVGATLALA